MKWKWAILSMALLSACSQRSGLTYRTVGNPVVSSSLAPHGEEPARATGLLDVAALLGVLIQREVVYSYPAEELHGEPLNCLPSTRIIDVITALESRMNWIYDAATRRFYRTQATHTIDSPDAFGRATTIDRAALTPRPIIALSFRIVRGGLGATLAADGKWVWGASAGQAIREVSLSAPDGVQTEWADTTSRTYFEGVRDPEAGAQQRQVTTNLRAVNAGTLVNVLASRLPNTSFRIDGSLRLSSFIGDTLGEQSLTVPLQMDGRRHEWILVFVSEGRDQSGELSINSLRVHARAGSDAVAVWLRAD